MISKYVIYANRRTGVDVYEKGDVVVKRYAHPSLSELSSEIVMCSTEWYGMLQSPLRFKYDENTTVLKTYSKKGTPLTKFSEGDVEDVIRHLAVMEAHGIIHGDIKIENIVRIDGKACMIDYGILSGRTESKIRLQTYTDKYGSAIYDGYTIDGYDAVSAAMYALGLTICVAEGLIDTDIIRQSKMESDTLVSGELKIPVTTWYYSKFIEYSLDSLIRARPILSRLLVAPNNRARSFWQLLDTGATRDIYDTLVKFHHDCKEIAICIQGYYMCGISSMRELVIKTKGQCMYWFDSSNLTLRLLKEYQNPGTWFSRTDMCSSLEELKEHLDNNAPQLIAYSFGVKTYYIRSTSL